MLPVGPVVAIESNIILCIAILEVVEIYVIGTSAKQDEFTNLFVLLFGMVGVTQVYALSRLLAVHTSITVIGEIDKLHQIVFGIVGTVYLKHVDGGLNARLATECV